MLLKQLLKVFRTLLTLKICLVSNNLIEMPLEENAAIRLTSTCLCGDVVSKVEVKKLTTSLKDLRTSLVEYGIYSSGVY